MTTRPAPSLTARIINGVAGLVATRRDTPEAFQRRIEQNRRRGPARPPGRMLRSVAFTDQRLGEDRIFRIEPIGTHSRLRLLYLHGGAYVHELQSVQWALTAGLIKRIPATVIAPIYPLAPEHTWREGLASVERVYRRAVEEVGAHNVIVYGDSAGGGLALALAQRLRDSGSPLPAALILFSPWLDVSVSGADQPNLARRDPVLSIDFLRRAGRLWASDIPVDDPRVSPLFGNHKDLPPTMVFSGSRDILDSDALRLAAANPEIEHRHFPGMMHVWPAAPMPEGRQALDQAADFIRRHHQFSPKR